MFMSGAGYRPEDAEDLTQGFFARLLEHDFLRNVAREKGTFRSFLLRSLKNFLINERARATRRKRGGGQTFVSWEQWVADRRGELEPVAEETPEKNYDQRWALTLFDHALARLRAECLASAKPELFDHLKNFLTADAAPGEYATAGGPLGMTSNAVAVTVHRLRQRYRQLLREELAHTVTDPGEIEPELRYLVKLLSQ